MEENILYISPSTYGEYEEKLKILNKEGFDKLLKKLEDESIDRNLAGMVHYEDLKNIVKTLLAFDKIDFDGDYGTGMVIRNWKKLNETINLNMTEYECMQWILNGMINELANIIDEDIRYGVDNSFFKDFRDLLCLMNIQNKQK
ncbi:hypothetical protein FDB14_17475 [Clostridium botulinum]|nr:hypothetical protein [Clostridium botulinum]NFK69437.1 hypothetical protein [Clostridium botulinum]NFK97955.1 hypothetical protein [Clostridium botulinum]